MAVNLIKLCVGIEDVEDLASAQHARLDAAFAAGDRNPQIRHVTRNTPKRAQELLDCGGSLYWVIRRVLRVRQRITGFQPVEREDGKPACAIILDPELVRVHPRKSRPFQGWRYLAETDTPKDLSGEYENTDHMPELMADELRELGLL